MSRRYVTTSVASWLTPETQTMKICIPTIRAERVGTVVSTATDYLYDCPDRPNVYGEVTEVPLIERKLAAKVVFDRDLRVVARLKATVALAAFSAVSVIVVPPVVACVAVGKAVELLADNVVAPLVRRIRQGVIDRLVPSLRYAYGFRATFSTLIAEIVK